LQADTAPLQHDHGPRHGTAVAIGNADGINGTVEYFGAEGITVAEVEIGRHRRSWLQDLHQWQHQGQ
jgi:hypothetical protein